MAGRNNGAVDGARGTEAGTAKVGMGSARAEEMEAEAAAEATPAKAVGGDVGDADGGS